VQAKFVYKQPFYRPVGDEGWQVTTVAGDFNIVGLSRKAISLEKIGGTFYYCIPTCDLEYIRPLKMVVLGEATYLWQGE
jgi:hypothetical protein